MFLAKQQTHLLSRRNSCKRNSDHLRLHLSLEFLAQPCFCQRGVSHTLVCSPAAVEGLCTQRPKWIRTGSGQTCVTVVLLWKHEGSPRPSTHQPREGSRQGLGLRLHVLYAHGQHTGAGASRQARTEGRSSPRSLGCCLGPNLYVVCTHNTHKAPYEGPTSAGVGVIIKIVQIVIRIHATTNVIF